MHKFATNYKTDYTSEVVSKNKDCFTSDYNFSNRREMNLISVSNRTIEKYTSRLVKDEQTI